MPKCARTEPEPTWRHRIRAAHNFTQVVSCFGGKINTVSRGSNSRSDRCGAGQPSAWAVNHCDGWDAKRGLEAMPQTACQLGWGFGNDSDPSHSWVLCTVEDLTLIADGMKSLITWHHSVWNCWCPAASVCLLQQPASLSLSIGRVPAGRVVGRMGLDWNSRQEPVPTICSVLNGTGTERGNFASSLASFQFGQVNYVLVKDDASRTYAERWQIFPSPSSTRRRRRRVAAVAVAVATTANSEHYHCDHCTIGYDCCFKTVLNTFSTLLSCNPLMMVWA